MTSRTAQRGHTPLPRPANPPHERPAHQRPPGKPSRPGRSLIRSFTLAGALCLAIGAGFVTVMGPDSLSRLGSLVGWTGGKPPVGPDGDRLAGYLARSTLMTLADANRTGHYEVLRLKASPRFQAAQSGQSLADAFQAIRNAELDLSVAVTDQPDWIEPPAVGADNLLRLIGAYPTADGRIKFAMAFEAQGGLWKLLEIHVGTDTDRQRPGGRLALRR